MHRRAVALAAVLIAASARGSNLTNQFLVNTAQLSDGSPRGAMFTNALDGSFDLGQTLALEAGLSLSLLRPTGDASFAQADQSSLVTLLTAGVNWTASDTLTLHLELDFSPISTQFAGTPVSLQQPNGSELNGEAVVRSQTSSFGAAFDLSWDSPGSSNLEWSVDGGIHYAHYDVDQNVSGVRVGSNTITTATLRQETNAYCQAHPRIKNCGRALLNALRAVPVRQDLERLSASATAIVYGDTDLTLGADYYVYQQDPAQVSYFGLAAAGRGPGVPIAPLSYLVRAEALHRFGDFSARIWGEAGEYVSGTGQGTAALGTRLQYRFNKAFRAWLSFSGQRDLDSSDNVTRSGTVSGGVGYRW